MPRIFFEGREFKVPGAYGAIKVVSSLAGPLPQFHTPIILGHAFDGHPYNADTKMVAGESDFTPFKRCNTDSATATYYGAQSDLHRGMQFAKRHGLPYGFMVALSDMVRFSIVAQTIVGTIEQFTLYPRTFGPAAGHRTVQFTGGVFTTTPLRRYATLASSALSGATRLYTYGEHSWLSIGAVVNIGSNGVANVSRTVVNAGVELTAEGQEAPWIEISSAVGSALLLAQYPIISQPDSNNLEISPVFTASQAMIDWFNEFSDHWIAVKHANFTDALPGVIVTAAPIKEVSTWGTIVAGTAPATTQTDLEDFIAQMNAGDHDAFADREQAIPQAYLLLNSDSDLHKVARDYAAAERLRGFPISITTGGAWGDVEIGAGDDTDPTFRAGELNSQDVMLVAGGINREGAFLSLAPAIYGRRVAGGPGHNLTNDELTFDTLEKKWDEINSGELSALCTAGVATYKFSIGSAGFRYKVSQGLSTLQANQGPIWNTSDSTTWAVMQRDLADAVLQVMLMDYEEWTVGADRVVAAGIASILTRRASSLERAGWVKPGTVGIQSITLNDAGNGYDVVPFVRLPDTVDFITLLLTILVGE